MEDNDYFMKLLDTERLVFKSFPCHADKQSLPHIDDMTYVEIFDKE